MANVGQTMFRFACALLLAAGATGVDHPGLLVNPTPAKLASVPVVVAAKDIPEGVVIDRGALRVAQWPVVTRPVGAYASIDSVAHWVSRTTIYKGEAILPGRLAPQGLGTGLEVKVKPGKRAFGIRINNDPATISESVKPNSRVDVMVVIDDPNKPGARVAKVFMSNMRVLAIGRYLHQPRTDRGFNPMIATLEVTPDQAEMLAIAGAQGELRLVPRTPD